MFNLCPVYSIRSFNMSLMLGNRNGNCQLKLLGYIFDLLSFLGFFLLNTGSIRYYIHRKQVNPQWKILIDAKVTKDVSYDLF